MNEMMKNDLIYAIEDVLRDYPTDEEQMLYEYRQIKDEYLSNESDMEIIVKLHRQLERRLPSGLVPCKDCVKAQTMNCPMKLQYLHEDGYCSDGVR